MAKKTAMASHILVKTESQAKELLQKLKKGADFDRLAQRFSTCPSAKKGGDLGEFARGSMVKPFDDAVFKGPLHQIQGPIKTKFGYHLIKVHWRSE